MVLFIACERNCEEYNADIKLDKIVEKLNSEFGGMSCNCHPEHTWEIGVDNPENCIINLHELYKPQPDCRFAEKLIIEARNEFL